MSFEETLSNEQVSLALSSGGGTDIDIQLSPALPVLSVTVSEHVDQDEQASGGDKARHNRSQLLTPIQTTDLSGSPRGSLSSASMRELGSIMPASPGSKDYSKKMVIPKRAIYGRAREAKFLKDALDDICEPGKPPKVVVMRGEIGSGKSHILNQLRTEVLEKNGFMRKRLPKYLFSYLYIHLY